MTATSTYPSQLTPEQIRIAKEKYSNHKRVAKQRGIPWQFTFETWIAKWLASGQWFNRGTKRGQYVMCRTSDKGPYSPENTRIDTNASNLQEAKTPEWRAKQKAGIQAKVQDPSWLASNKAAAEKRAQDPNWQAKHKAAMQSKAQNPEWQAKHTAQLQKALCKPVHTLLGDFGSVKEAIAAHKISPPTLRRLMKKHPQDYYYLPKQ